MLPAPPKKKKQNKRGIKRVTQGFSKQEVRDSLSWKVDI